MGKRITAMSLGGKAIEPAHKYKVAGWAPVSEEAKAAGGEPVWDVVARYLRGQKTVAPRKLNLPTIVGIVDNQGFRAP
jgi:sulfur-oxidizing protein SoxB